jgi:hypothetical protein
MQFGVFVGGSFGDPERGRMCKIEDFQYDFSQLRDNPQVSKQQSSAVQKRKNLPKATLSSHKKIVKMGTTPKKNR